MTASARFRLPPMCACAAPAALQAWFETARAEEGIVYASGHALDRQHRTAVKVAGWRDIGAVRTHQKRRADGGWDWIAVKRGAGSAPERADGPIRPGQPAPDPDSEQGRVLAMLKQAAKFGLPCPSNGEIARALGLKDRQAARYHVGALARARIIIIENRGPRCARIVTIAATGQRSRAAASPVGKGFAGATGESGS